MEILCDTIKQITFVCSLSYKFINKNQQKPTKIIKKNKTAKFQDFFPHNTSIRHQFDVVSIRITILLKDTS